MANFLAGRLEGLVQSPIRRMTRECNRVGGINLGQGVCDLPTPPLVAAGAKAAIDANQAMYSYPEGVPELREAIAEKLARDNGITADPDSEIVVTVGSSGAFTCAINALLNPGTDGILLMEPYYGYHLNCALIAGFDVQYMTLAPPAFALTEENLRASLQPNTRAIVVCTPSNPSGKMFSREELEIVARIAEEKDLLVITDEIYEYIRYDGREHISPATVGNLRERSVSIMGLSKTFSITGWRLGYAVAPAPMAKAMTLVNDLYYICAPTPLQYGVAAGMAAPPEFFASIATDYQRKRDFLCPALEEAGMTPIVPQGAYYVLADVTRLGHDTAMDASMDLLENGGVASVPGSAFYRGATGEKLVRFCYAKEDDVLGLRPPARLCVVRRRCPLPHDRDAGVPPAQRTPRRLGAAAVLLGDGHPALSLWPAQPRRGAAQLEQRRLDRRDGVPSLHHLPPRAPVDRPPPRPARDPLWHRRSPLQRGARRARALPAARARSQLALGFTLVTVTGCVLSLGFERWRNRIDPGVDRANVMLLGAVLAFFPAGAALIVHWVFGSPFPWYAGMLGVFLFPAAIGYGIVRNQLFEIRLAARSSAAYGVVTLAITGLFALSISFADLLFERFNVNARSPAFSVAFLFLAILFFNPVRNRIQRIVDAFFDRDRVAYGNAVREIFEAMVSMLSVKEIVDRILVALTDTMGVERAMVLLIDDEEHALGVVASRGDWDDDFGELDLSADHPVCRHLWTRRHELARSDFDDEQDPELREACRDVFDSLDAALLVPILYGVELLGVIAVGRKLSGDRLGSDDRQLLRTLANQSSIAIENAKAFDEIAKLNETLEARVEERTDQLRHTQAQLVQSEKMRTLGQLVAGVAHELNNPIGFVHANLQLLGGYVSKLESDDQQRATAPRRQSTSCWLAAAKAPFASRRSSRI